MSKKGQIYKGLKYARERIEELYPLLSKKQKNELYQNFSIDSPRDLSDYVLWDIEKALENIWNFNLREINIIWDALYGRRAESYRAGDRERAKMYDDVMQKIGIPESVK